MKTTTIKLLSLSGILGSFLMFTGDMLLYYEPVSGMDYNSTARMATMPIWRLVAGGISGPVASVFSIISGYMFYLLFRQVNKTLATFLFGSFAVFFVFGGSYHALFPNLGFIGRLPDSFQSEQINYVRTYLKTINLVIYFIGTIWTIALFYLVIFKRTPYPKWLLLFTPTLLILLAGFIKNMIPYPLGAIVYGGWINLSFMLYFIICFLYFNRLKKPLKNPGE